MPKIEVPKGRLKVSYSFGMSELSDLDNKIKQFQDIIANKYGFNDRDIYKIIAEKEVVKNGDEFIEFNIEKYD